MAGSDDSDVGDSEGVRSDSSTSSVVFFAVALEIEAAKSGIKRARSISIARSSKRDARQTGIFTADAVLLSREFDRTFRLSRICFEKLLNLIGSFLEPKLSGTTIEGRKRAGSSVLRAVDKVQLSLRILAGGSYLDLARIHSISSTTLYEAFAQFFCLLSSGCIRELRIKFPASHDELKNNAEKFQALSSNTPELYGCIGALDGISVRIIRPSIRRVPNAITYFCRKGFFCLNMQAVCDASLRFIYVSMETPGSTHDSTALNGTKFASDWNMVSPDEPYWIAADEAYVSTHNIVTPWPGRLLNNSSRKWRHAFNYFFSGGNRNTIERAFGVLVAKFGILWRPIAFHLEDVPRILLTACALHNFLIDEGSDALLGGNSTTSLATQGPGIVLTSDYQSRPPELRRRDRECCLKREQMTIALQRHGIARPEFL
jgi:DDE superfamily endonuclease